MTHPAVDGESLDDFVARISDVLRFVFAQQRNDMVVFVGEDGIARELLPQSQPRPPAPTLAPAGDRAPEIVSGRTRIRRINETLLVAL